jgi:integrase/recombinase XerD
MYESCHNDFEKMIISVLYDTACRRSELLKIKIKDIKFKNKNIENENSDMKKGVFADVLLHGKGNKNRTACLSKLSVELIKSVHPYPEEDDKLVVMKKSDGVLYESQSQALYRFICDKGQRALSRHVHTHMLRHTKLTHLADNGATVLGIMAYAGHEDIKTSQIYIEISSFIGTRTYAEHSKPVIDIEIGDDDV